MELDSRFKDFPRELLHNVFKYLDYRYMHRDIVRYMYEGEIVNMLPRDCGLIANKPYAFNFFSTHARYPQYRARENQVLNLGARINNCIERPHIGKHLPLDSKEIIAIQCYMNWLCEKVPVNGHVKVDGPLKVKYPDRAADPVKGEVVYKRDCAVCRCQRQRAYAYVVTANGR